MKEIAVSLSELLLEVLLMFVLGSIFGAIVYYFVPTIHWSIVGLGYASYAYGVKYLREFKV